MTGCAYWRFLNTRFWFRITCLRADDEACISYLLHLVTCHAISLSHSDFLPQWTPPHLLFSHYSCKWIHETYKSNTHVCISKSHSLSAYENRFSSERATYTQRYENAYYYYFCCLVLIITLYWVVVTWIMNWLHLFFKIYEVVLSKSSWWCMWEKSYTVWHVAP